MKSLRFFGLWLSLCCAVCLGQTSDKPNVLFIAIDDLNDWVGPLQGHPQVKTPNMDRLAERVLPSPTPTAITPCNPSRTSLLTGKRPSTTGISGSLLAKKCPGIENFCHPATTFRKQWISNLFDRKNLSWRIRSAQDGYRIPRIRPGGWRRSKARKETCRLHSWWKSWADGLGNFSP